MDSSDDVPDRSGLVTGTRHAERRWRARDGFDPIEDEAGPELDTDELMSAPPSPIASIQANFRFLAVEVHTQLKATLRVFSDPSPDLIDKIAERDDYIDNLKSVIENNAYRLMGDERLDRPTLNMLRAILVSTSNLERIADYAANLVGQMRYLTDKEMPNQYDPKRYFKEMLRAISIANDALEARDMSAALTICKVEITIDQWFSDVFADIMERLRDNQDPEDLVTTLFIYRYLERMGDSLLNIGEAVIFAALGEKLKVSQYQVLKDTLEASEVQLSLSEADYQGIWGTRSGCRIGTVNERGSDPEARQVIFKEGATEKMLQEKEALERWADRFPGVPPQVFGYQEHGDHAALLLEFLPGRTFQRMIIDSTPAELKNALVLILARIGSIWEGTYTPEPASANFLGQLGKRMRDVYGVHPEFRKPQSRIGPLYARSFEELVAEASPLERELASPFRVLTHGDFNTDNIIVNLKTQRVHYLDMHRSRETDYVQDVSVCLVSAFRMPVFDGGVRRRINDVSRELYRFASTFAAKHDDDTFDARLAFGLARSFVTSTRFELRKSFAKTMFMRGVYLLERGLAHRERGKPWSEYRLPLDVLSF